MAFQAVPFAVQVKLFGFQDGQTTINDLYFGEPNASPPFSDVVDLLSAVSAWYLGSIASLASSTWSFVRAQARVLATADGLVLDDSSNQGAGGVGGGAAPNNVSFAISFRTALGGRSNRGRNYVPGIPLQAVSGNTITSDFVDNYVQAYQALLVGGGVLPGDWTWVVVSRQTGGVVRPTGVTIPITTVLATDNIVDSQRRRLPGRGR